MTTEAIASLRYTVDSDAFAAWACDPDEAEAVCTAALDRYCEALRDVLINVLPDTFVEVVPQAAIGGSDTWEYSGDADVDPIITDALTAWFDFDLQGSPEQFRA